MSYEEERLQPKLIDEISPIIQRQETEKEEEEEEEEVIQPKRISDEGEKEILEIETYISRTKGLGNPLPPGIRAFMEERFGVDFSNVRIHADSEAARMARALNAEAFTYGRDIYFGEGRYRPETTEGKRLLAHELTHVVQQNLGKKIFRSIIQRTVKIRNTSLQVINPPRIKTPTITSNYVEFTSNWIKMLGKAQIKGNPTDNCKDYKFGFLQTEWHETNRAYYRGRFDRDGSVHVYRDKGKARPQRACCDTAVGISPWYDKPYSPQRCNVPISLIFSDSPQETYKLAVTNNKTGKMNYLHTVFLGFMFVTVWSAQRPDKKFRHFRSVYWNLRWYYRFKPNFSKSGNLLSWSIIRLSSSGNAISHVISGAPKDKRVPIYITPQPPSLICNNIVTQAANNPEIKENNKWKW